MRHGLASKYEEFEDTCRSLSREWAPKGIKILMDALVL
jgi:hypothetical protein